ncbi:MAG TPA: PDZ domain-containing protein [Gemmatimonadaceae bacterium]|nr:PDZ domain-containing protein [Gemmatimonadaceae bacterium]
MRLAFLLLAPTLVLPTLARAQDPLDHYSDAFETQFAPDQPVLHYTVRVDGADLQQFEVRLDVRGAPDTLVLRLPIWAPGAYRVADFAQYVRDLSATTGEDGDDALSVRAEPDSSRWTVVTRDGRATVRYAVRFPSAVAAHTPNNRSFLQPTGGLLDGPLTYVYVEGEKLAPAHVTFQLPDGWRIATGLRPTSDPRTFFAPSYDVLVDSPVLMGALHVWPFTVDGVPHRAAYWPSPAAVPFDTTAFVAAVRRSVEGARTVFGRLPYRDYTFLFIDGTGGGLEHLNSTSIGVRSTSLARDPRASTGVTTHEFFHAWNVKRLRPAPLGPFDYQHPVHTTGLWFAEGVTDYYADAIARRVGFVDEARARDALATSIESYLNNPAHDRVSPERSSWTAWNGPGANDGYSISYYLQGALIGELLDVQLRQATGLRRGMDDVMRLMFARYAGAQGYRGEDIVHAVNDVCGCDLHRFFDRHVAGAQEIDFDSLLAPLGWRVVATRAAATTDDGAPAPDLRISVTGFAGIGSAGGVAGSTPKLSLSDPTSAWYRAGLRAGDAVLRVNDRPVTDGDSFRAALGQPAIGSQVRVTVRRDGRELTVPVTVTGYERVAVRLEDVAEVTPAMRAMRRAWMTGTAPTSGR